MFQNSTKAGVTRSEDTDTRQATITDRNSELPTDKHFLDLSKTCLYLV